MPERIDVRIPAEGGITLAAWLYRPEGIGPHPAITMAHGFGGIKEQGLDPVARSFAEKGFLVLVHDHRNLGASEGEPRGDINPWTQITDWRRAISYLESLDEVDANRIGLWGTSYAGGHAIVLGATDRRLTAIVAQVPVTDGVTTGQRRVPPDTRAALEREFDEDERGQLAGRPPVSRALVSADQDVPAFYRDPNAVTTYLQPLPDGVTFENRATLRSMRWSRMYTPAQWIDQVSPTPLLMIVAREDTTSGTDLALRAYERALEPKRLELIPGNHFDPYDKQRDVAIAAAAEWFEEHLMS